MDKGFLLMNSDVLRNYGIKYKLPKKLKEWGIRRRIHGAFCLSGCLRCNDILRAQEVLNRLNAEAEETLRSGEQ